MLKVYLSDEVKVKSYVLPSKVEDTFLINYESPDGIYENIIFTPKDGKWCIKTNSNLIITSNGAFLDEIIIEPNTQFELKYADLNREIYFFCFESPMHYFDLSTEIVNSSYGTPTQMTEISVGKSNTTIIYENELMSDYHLLLKKTDGKWSYYEQASIKSPVYVNGKRIGNCVLNNGDVLFVAGLKIIIMDKNFRINNAFNKVKTSLTINTIELLQDVNSYTPVKENEKNVKLFENNEVFFHTPRITQSIVEKKVKIAPPPKKDSNQDPPLILTLGSTIMMGFSSTATAVVALINLTSGEFKLANFIVQIITCLALVLGTTLFPVLLNTYNKKRKKKNEEKRQIKYIEYLKKKEKEIDDIVVEQTAILNVNNPSSKECADLIAKTTSDTDNKIWYREIADSDFLNVRVGTGDINAKYDIDTNLDDFSLDDDNLLEMVKKINEERRILENIPITVSLTEDKVLPILIDKQFYRKQEFINSLLLQLITLHSGKDLKIVVLTNKSTPLRWNELKSLPHLFSNDRSIHFYSNDDEETKTICKYLDDIFISRVETATSNNVDENKDDNKNDGDINKDIDFTSFDEYYLIITDNYLNLQNNAFLDKIINTKRNLGFSLITIDSTLQNMPSKVETIVEIGQEQNTIISKDTSKKQNQSFYVETFNDNYLAYSNVIANIPLLTNSAAENLPSNVAFLELYKVGKVEQLNALSTWQRNDPTTSLKIPVGINNDGKLFYLDLHEKSMGPHGLIAGTTGSGKSGWIVTFVLSLAVSFHPYEVQFLLIDYKGGELAGAFENKETGVKIPHLVGTITNLDTSSMHRAMVSITSELKRRQTEFNKARDALGESTVDIYKYQRFYREGKLEKPISHLFIISDEFAELKSQQPDFMNELISISRIGRSLGVHLILATQKPSGVVDDQIWSNSRFKVCLKVSTTSDSNELLKRPEAAFIKEAGRFYLQIGYDEIFELGQSAWTGAKYMPTESLQKHIDDSIIFINNIGETIKVVNDEQKIDTQENLGDQLSNIVKYLHSLAVRENLKSNPLWLPTIPSTIYLDDIIKKYNYQFYRFKFDTIIGEYDMPEQQKQDILSLDLSKGSMGVYGLPGSGREKIVSTILYNLTRIHSSEEINFYIVDYGAETLKFYQNFPHVGNMFMVDNSNEIVYLMNMLLKELSKRKKVFSNYGGSFETYNKTSQEKYPLIIVPIVNFEAFEENCEDSIEPLSILIREGSRYGITFVITATGLGSIPLKMAQYFVYKIGMKLQDPFDYRYSFNAPAGLIPYDYMGRGLIAMEDTAYEFQTAFFAESKDVNDTITKLGNKLSELNMKKAKVVPILPKSITAAKLSKYLEDIKSVPIGIDVEYMEYIKYDFKNNKYNLILGNSLLFDNSFIIELIKLLSSIPDINLNIVDFADTIKDVDSNVEYHNEGYTDAINDILRKEKENQTQNVVLINGAGYLYEKVLDEGIEAYNNIFNSLNNFTNTSFIIVDNSINYNKLSKENWYKTINYKNGIWFGDGIENQEIFDISNINDYDIEDRFPGKAYIFENDKCIIVKTMCREDYE